MGLYVSHIRSESNRLLEAADELIRIAGDAGIRAEFYHLKVAGQPNWHKLGALIQKIEAARAEGLAITANMYNYTAAGTGLRRRDAALGPGRRRCGMGAAPQRPRHAPAR